MLVSIVAVYFFDGSIVIGGGAENCLGAEDDTAAPWAAGEPLLDGEADGCGSGLSPLLIWPADGGVVAGLAAADVGAGGAAFWPQAVSSTMNTTGSTRKTRVKWRSSPATVPGEIAVDTVSAVVRSSSVIVTRPNLVPRRTQAYDARIVDGPAYKAGREDRVAGRLYLETREQA